MMRDVGLDELNPREISMATRQHLIALCTTALLLGACGGADDNNILSNWNGTPMEVDPDCSSARLTRSRVLSSKNGAWGGRP